MLRSCCLALPICHYFTLHPPRSLGRTGHGTKSTTARSAAPPPPGYVLRESIRERNPVVEPCSGVGWPGFLPLTQKAGVRFPVSEPCYGSLRGAQASRWGTVPLAMSLLSLVLPLSCRSRSPHIRVRTLCCYGSNLNINLCTPHIGATRGAAHSSGTPLRG